MADLEAGQICSWDAPSEFGETGLVRFKELTHQVLEQIAQVAAQAAFVRVVVFHGVLLCSKGFPVSAGIGRRRLAALSQFAGWLLGGRQRGASGGLLQGWRCQGLFG